MWYYTENEQQRGPVMESDLVALQRDGKITAETLVWREGMADWQPWGQVQPTAASAGQPSAPPRIEATPGVDQVVCSQCGGIFPASEVIRYGSAAVCAACKPIFVQKLKEGVTITGSMEFAGFWLRFAAYFLDGIITGAMGWILGFFGSMIAGAVGVMGPERGPNGAVMALQLSLMGLGYVLSAAYYIYFIGKDGQTPGKKLCRIRVVNADGSKVSYGKAAGRFFGYLLSGLICYIGFFMAGWDEEKRALHDRLCDTRVITA